jgi:epoxyqueuosine reductase
VPVELREKLGSRIHGCDKCQQVCPRNIKVRDKLVLPKDEYLEELSKDLTLSAILNMDDEFFKTRIQPIMYNYISKPRLFRRNAIIAMGNSGDKTYIKDLEVAMNSDDDLISRYAGWALENLRMNPGNKSE